MKPGIISKAFNEIMNAKRAGKEVYIAKPISKLLIEIFKIMKENGYIDYKTKKKKFGQILVTIKKLNECKTIKPKFNVGKKNIDKYVRRFLPARDLGIIIISTNKGLKTNKDMETGGCLIAYCY